MYMPDDLIIITVDCSSTNTSYVSLTFQNDMASRCFRG